jgi:integrase
MSARTIRTKIRHRPNGRWYVSVIDADGKEHAPGGYRLEREAKAARDALVADAKRQGYVAPDVLSVGEWLVGEWREMREHADISVNSRDVERIAVDAWIVPHVGSIELQKLTARDIDRLYARLRERGGRAGKPLRGKSVRNAHGVLSKALADAVRRGRLTASPMAGVDPPARDDSVERAAWSAEEVRTFLEVAAGDRLHAVWRLALVTGLRRGELTGLSWDDVDDASVKVSRQVLVRPRATSGTPRVYVRETTKTRRIRRVRFDASTSVALRAWKAAQNEERLAFGAAWKIDGGLGLEVPWIATEAHGYVVHPDTLLRRWKALVKSAGVTPISLHGARHSYAELALASGVRLDVVSRQLGHATISTTANVYTHDNDEAARQAADAVARAIEGGSGG